VTRSPSPVTPARSERLDVRPLPAGREADWETFVRAAAGSTFCHAIAWRDIMENALGHECLYLGAWDRDGRLAGVLPLARVRSRLFGHFLVSVPFLNYGGPLGSDEARSLLARRAAAIAEESGADLLELRSRDRFPTELSLNQRKVTVVLALPDDAEMLWKEGLPAKVRSQVRRPMKEGLEARFGADQITAFYDVFARHMRDLGTPVLPRSLFDAIAAAFGDDVLFGVVYRGTEPVASGCGFVWGDELEITWAAALREHSRVAPNMLLYWKFMERSVERGLRTFNFGRCTPGAGTHRFKRQWGGEDVPLPWLQWSKGGVSATPSPDGGRLFRMATEAWKRIPLPVAARLGPPLARRLP
jgi:serine/alanine adding enzyme